MSNSRSTVNPWIVAVAVVVPTFMEVLDTTIANVALRYIAGGLSAAESDAEWVITSYLAANAVVLPISGWLSDRLGRRNYFIGSIALFTTASFFCGVASSIEELVLFRVIQGVAGGGLQPSTQGILLDEFPKEKQGLGMTLFGIAALLAPIVGPTLGGYITDHYSWRWVFLINIPVGVAAVLFCYAVVSDPPYLIEERKKMIKKGARFDLIGLGLLVTAVACWETVLSKGQEWNWLADAYWRLQPVAVVMLLAVVGFVAWELTCKNPVVNLRPLGDRNFVVAVAITACAYGILYGQSTTLPAMLQRLFGYDATYSGLVLSPAGVFSVALLPVVGFLLGKGTDARWLIGPGLVIMALGNYWYANLNLEVSPWQIVWPRVITIVGLSLLFAPLNVAAYASVPRELQGAAVGLLSLFRNEGGSVGTSIAQAAQERRYQFHTERLGEYLDPLNPALAAYRDPLAQYFTQRNGDAVLSQRMAMQVVENVREKQATSLAYFDVFWLFAVLAAILVPMVLLMRHAVKKEGAPVGE